MIIDAHQHFWKIENGIYDWIGQTIQGIKRDYQPEHLQPYINHLNVNKTILVQAAENLLENKYMLEAAKHATFVGGIVAWVDLESATAKAELENLQSHSIIKGIRPVLQGIEDSEWILQDRVVNALQHVASLGLTFDALIQPRHLPAIQQLVHLVPDLKVVIDHGAKPVIADGQLPSEKWKDGLTALGQHPNVHCKISGLVTEHGNGWSTNSLTPVAQHLFNAFPANRLMWGSDWPVLELNGSYTQWFECLNELISSLSRDDQAHIMGKTAADFYNLEM